MAVSRRMDKNILIHSHKGMQYSKETKWTTTTQNPMNLMKKNVDKHNPGTEEHVLYAIWFC